MTLVLTRICTRAILIQAIYTYVTGTYLTETGISSDSYYSKIDTRSVEETYTGTNSVITDKTVKFSAKLWLISREELQLLSCATYGMDNNNANCEAYGIGCVSGAGAWWLRSACTVGYAGYVSEASGYLFRVYVTSAVPGIRAAFQIQI